MIFYNFYSLLLDKMRILTDNVRLLFIESLGDNQKEITPYRSHKFFEGKFFRSYVSHIGHI